MAIGARRVTCNDDLWILQIYFHSILLNGYYQTQYTFTYILYIGSIIFT